jgi:hypothetical protein
LNYTAVFLLLVLAGSAAAQLGQYAGPSILSSGTNRSGLAGREPVALRGFVSVDGAYDSGLFPVSLSNQGQLLDTGSAGVDLTYGLYATKLTRRNSFDLNYAGTYRHYTNNTYYNGLDQFLDFIFTRQLSRRWDIAFQETGGTSARAYGGIVPGFPGAGQVSVPVNELFDNRVYFSETSMRLGYQPTRRLFFTVAGDGFLVRRQSKALVGLNGYQFRGSAGYRIRANQSISVEFTNLHFDYPRAFGSADGNSIGLAYVNEFGRGWTANARLAAIRIAVLGVQQVNVDPVIAAIVGQTTTFVIANTVSYLPYFELGVTRRRGKNTVSVNYIRGVSPGNGVYLASRNQSVSGSVSYTGIRRWNFGATLGYNAFHSLGQQLAPFRQVYGGAGATYKLRGPMYLNARFDFREGAIQAVNFGRTTYRISAGLTYSPGLLPVSLW